MSEAHTADLGTRYRYRQEGAEAERERIIQLLFQWGISAREENNCRDDSIALELIALIKGKQND